MAWNRSNNGDAESFPRQKRGKSSILTRKGFRVPIAVALVVVGGALTYFLLQTSDEPEPSAKSTVDTEPSRLIAASSASAASPAATEHVAPTNAPRPQKRTIPRKPDGTIDWTKIKPSELPPEMVGSDTPPAEPVRQVFSNSADQIIAMVISTPPDQDLPPIVGLGDDLEVQFFKSLENPIQINDDDSAEVKTLKENLIATKKQIMEMINSGMTVTEILQEHQETFSQNRRDFAENQAIVDRFFKEGDAESARLYIEKVNPILESMGAPLLQMPKTREERRAERRARRAVRKAAPGSPVQ